MRPSTTCVEHRVIERPDDIGDLQIPPTDVKQEQGYYSVCRQGYCGVYRTLDRATMSNNWEEFIQETDWTRRSLETTPNWFLEIMIEDTEGDRILDIASGDGSIEELFRGDTIVGADISKNRLDGVELPVQANAERLPFQTESLDSVVSIETIEHLSNPGAFVDEIHRILKPDGTAYIKTPNKLTHDIFQLSNGNLDRRKEAHPSVLTPTKFERLFAQFSSIDMFDVGLLDYQKEKIKAANPTLAKLVEYIPFSKLPKFFQPSITAVVRK